MDVWVWVWEGVVGLARRKGLGWDMWMCRVELSKFSHWPHGLEIDPSLSSYGGLQLMGVVVFSFQSFSEASRAASMNQDAHLQLSRSYGVLSLVLVLGSLDISQVWAQCSAWEK